MKQPSKTIIANAALIVIIILGIIWVCHKFVHIGNVEFTNNAQVKQHITPVSTRVQGFIKEIRFEEYGQVNSGDTLVLIEDAEYRLRVASAQADLSSAHVAKEAMLTTINTTEQNIAVTDAAIKETKIRLAKAQKDYDRYKELIREEAVTVQQYDAVKTEYDATVARLDQLEAQKKSQMMVKREQTQRIDQSEAAIKLAEAALDLAELNLSYCVIVANADGVTGRKNIHEGELVQPGQTMVSIVDRTDKWIIANYKETQTTSMAPGQKVDISVDAVPDVKYKGVIESISDATGASYSMIPQDNSAGNFVKVEQRIPVKIVFTDENSDNDLARLRAGMNAECRVRR